MKKLGIALAVVLTLVLGLCALTVAGMDAMYADINTLQWNGSTPDSGLVGSSTVKINVGQKLYILGWFAEHGKSVDKVVWTLDGEEKECADNYRDRTEIASIQAFADAGWVAEDFIKAGYGKDADMMELLGVDELTDGTYKVAIIGKFTDGSSQTLKSEFTLVVGDGGGVVTQSDHPIKNGGESIGAWIQKGKETNYVEFTTAGKINGFNFHYWASSPATGTGPKATWKAELYKFEKNPDYSFTKAPLKSVEVTSEGDNNPVVNVKWDDALDAGTYIIKFTLLNPDYTEEFNGETKRPYLVLPKIDNPDTSKFAYGGTVFNLSVYGDDVDGDFFIENPANVDAPEIFNIDYVWLHTSGEVIENVGTGPDIGNIKVAVDKGAELFSIIGWYYPQKPIDHFEIQVDDGARTAVAGVYNADTAAVIGSWGYADYEWYRNYTATIQLLEGEHTVNFYVVSYDGTEKLLYSTHYLNDDSNVAYGKRTVVGYTAGAPYGSPYWSEGYLTDGTKWKFSDGTVKNPVPLGWYVQDPADNMIYIDLEDVYDLTEIKLYPMGFAYGTFPNTFTVYTSLDMAAWDVVGGESGLTGNFDSAAPFSYTTANRARYICVVVNTGNNGQVSLGEIEAYGTFVEEGNGLPAYLPYYSNYGGGVRYDDPWNDSSWTGFNTGSLENKIVFNTDVPISAIQFPAAWAAADTPVTFTFKKDGAVVATVEKVFTGDGGFILEFADELPAGEYVLDIKITDDTVNPENGAYAYYLALGYADAAPYGKEYVDQQRGRNVAINLYSSDTTGEGFIKRNYKEGMSRDQVRVDGVDKASVGGNAAVTDIAENLYDSIGKNINFWGWYGNNMGLDKFGVKVDGGEMVYSDRYSDPSIAAHLTNNVFNGDIAYSDRFNIDVEITEGEHTAEVYAITNDGEVLVWTINYKATAAHVPVTRSFDSATDNQYFDSIFINDEEGPRANGNDAVAALKALIDGSAEEINKIGLYGWFASDSPIEQFGYILDDADPVFDDSFVAPFGSPEEEATITGTRAGGKRYRVNVDVSGLKDGAIHVIKVVAKLENGDIVIFDRPNREAIVNYQAPASAETPFVEYMSRDQVTIDGVDKASFGGNAEVTDIADNLYADLGKQLRFWGWYGNNKSLEKYGVRVDGGEAQYFDRYEAEDIVNHFKANLIKDDDVYASRFEIFVDITEGQHTAEVFAVVNGEEHLIWTINYKCMPEEAPAQAEVTAEVNDEGKLVVTVTGEFGDKDWIGIYADGNTPGGSAASLVWWYVGANGGTFELPFEGMSENDRAALLNDDGTVKAGKFVIYLLANDGYDLVEGTEGVEIVVEEQPETQPTTEPGTEPPQTGDALIAMFAVIVVLAMGAAVVFAKKRSF